MVQKRINISLSIFFPAYNEEANIGNTVLRAVEAAKQLVKEYEIIVINDGSIDNTANIVKNAIKSNPNIRLISHSRNKGYGAAVKTGLRNAKKEWIFFTDSDGQFAFDELATFITARNRADLVIGYRSIRRDPIHRVIIGKYMLRYWNFLLFGLKVRDVDCAYKLFRKDLVNNIRLTSESAITVTEFMVRSVRAGYTLLELPVTHYPRLYGKQTGGNLDTILKALKESLVLWRKFNSNTI